MNHYFGVDVEKSPFVVVIVSVVLVVVIILVIVISIIVGYINYRRKSRNGDVYSKFYHNLML